MRVLGASGFIGLPLAQAFVLIPVIGETSKPSSWLPLVATLDVVIDAVGGQDIRMLSETLLNTTAAAAQKHRPAHASKLTYIYTSGTWVHGDDQKEVKTDTTPIKGPVELLQWQPKLERMVIQSSVLNGIVIRPSLLYGKSASILAPLFRRAYEGKFYHLTAEKATIVAGLTIDATNDFTESVDDILQNLVKVSGAKGPYEYAPPSTPLEKAITATTLVRPYLALGWYPRKPRLIDGLEVYYIAWKGGEGL
ncbi:hypothetical protein DAEQUDRAFT_808055 [Daedalea quercina L-15889]|uniref:NAD(P)-binding protein n=1 Tax=Daedalea quercina L-15889 TaxID=1314783 RepID=A0A165TSI6_9APHY|nr:hypothetical protein DAEQUDRAFT_808055 [Daedalea quercina L-15889]